MSVLLTGCVTYYADGVFDEVYQNRLAFGHVEPCPQCIGLVAVLDRQYVGQLAYLTRPGEAEEGPFLIADCAAAKDLVRLQARGLVAERGESLKSETGEFFRDRASGEILKKIRSDLA